MEGVRLLPGLPRAGLGAVLRRAGVAPGFTLTRPDGTPAEDVAAFVFQSGPATLIALQRDLPPPDAAPAAETVVLTLPGPRWMRDLRDTAPVQRSARPVLALDPVVPTLLLVSESRP